MPGVSVLIPAYRPDYFEACLASAFAQTHEDLEVIVSDDCPGEDIHRIVLRQKDRRIRYERNPTRGRNFSNLGNLLRLARGRYLKFLWDDDVLYPRSVEMLLATLRATGAGLAFHHRHFIDERGRILAAPTFLPQDVVARIPDEAIHLHLVGRIVNWIGEPTNMMVDAEALRRIGTPFEAAGRGVRFLNDVCMLYHFARTGEGVAGIGTFGSGFRQHGSQGSNESAAIYSSGVFEWELLVRCAHADGKLPRTNYLEALPFVHGLYRKSARAHPVFDSLLAIDAGQGPGDALSPAYLRAVDLAYFEMDLRRVGPVVAASAGAMPGMPQKAAGS